MTVNLRVAQAGDLCQEVEVTGTGGLQASSRHCLSATTPAIEQPAPGEQRWEPEPSGVQPTPTPTPEQPATPATPPGPAAAAGASAATLSLRKTGADRRGVGESVLFIIEVTNRGVNPLEEVVIADNFETTLEPGRATENNEWLEGGALGWRIGTLAPGQSVRRDIELKTLQVTPQACNRVTVTARDMLPVAEEACIEVVAAQNPAPAAAPAGAPAAAAGPRQPLRVSVAETTDPVRVGGTTTYQITLENSDSQSYFDVVVSATLSDGLKLDTIAGHVGTEGQATATAVRFQPIREIRPGESGLNFELHVSAVRPGAAKVRVEVTSRGQTRPTVAEQSTQVLP